MTGSLREVRDVHPRLLHCTLEIEASRAYWAHSANCENVSAKQAFDEYWFGARSLARVVDLLVAMRERFDAYPMSLYALQRWPQMSIDARRAICHWHLQLTDPLYRAFAGEFLAERREGLRSDVTQAAVVTWIAEQTGERWAFSTRIQFASKLLSAAHAAGLVGSKRDPRPLALPRVPDEALEYLMYLMRDVQFDGTLMDNPYVASIGISGSVLGDRLRVLPGLSFKRQGSLIDFGWRYANLSGWADATLTADDARAAGGAP